jgi:Kef-type K+ transport system membrane component KefB
MDVHSIFLYLAVILFLARVFGDTFGRFGLPSVLGEIFVGVFLGQSVLGLIPVNDIIRILAEIGVILLLFQVGLEADIHQLRKVGVSAFVVAFIGAFTPMLLATLLAFYVFKLSFLTSLFIGGTLTATSIGIIPLTLFLLLFSPWFFYLPILPMSLVHQRYLVPLL